MKPGHRENTTEEEKDRQNGGTREEKEIHKENYRSIKQIRDYFQNREK